MHGFTAKELPDATTQYCKAISKAAIWSLPSSFKLQFPPFRLRIQDLAKSYCPTITQLTSPHAKLMSTVALSIWHPAVGRSIRTNNNIIEKGYAMWLAINMNNNTYAPAKGVAPEKKRGKSGLSNLKNINRFLVSVPKIIACHKFKK